MAIERNKTRSAHLDIGVDKRATAALTPSQQRVLEMEDGDSFVLHTIRIMDDVSLGANWRTSKITDVATHLAAWARRRHIRLGYRVIEKDTVRIWRLGIV